MKIGDYVICARWSDYDIEDPWFIGFLESIHEINGFTYYKVKESERLWRHCKKITKAKADKRFEKAKIIEQWYKPLYLH